jgi:hypothetical protein
VCVKWILKGFQEPGSEVARNQDDKRWRKIRRPFDKKQKVESKGLDGEC